MERMDFLPGLRKICRSKKAILMALSYSLFNGVIASWYSVMNITFQPLPLGNPEDTVRKHQQNIKIARVWNVLFATLQPI
jgi:hypothetical protein